MKKEIKIDKKETLEYHNTLLLLNKYRDVVWSLEVTTKKAKGKAFVTSYRHGKVLCVQS